MEEIADTAKVRLADVPPSLACIDDKVVANIAVERVADFPMSFDRTMEQEVEEHFSQLPVVDVEWNGDHSLDGSFLPYFRARRARRTRRTLAALANVTVCALLFITLIF